jgi:DNA polymerase-3 subunit delta
MAKVSGARGGSGQLAGQLGLAPWQIDRAKRDLQGWSGTGLGRCIEVLAETDAAVKGAERDPVFALERMVGVIAARGESAALTARSNVELRDTRRRGHPSTPTRVARDPAR